MKSCSILLILRYRFKWADLQIQHLGILKFPHKIEEALEKLPLTLNDTYAYIYSEIERGSHINEATAALQWLMCAEKPLNPREWIGGLYWATVGAEPDYHTTDLDVLLDICYNLVVCDTQGLMRFAHLSVREFLEHKPQLAHPEPHIMAANACLSFLTHTQPLPTTPFGTYAIDHWPFHSQKCSSQTLELLDNFFGTSSCPGSSYAEWLRVAPSRFKFKYSSTLDYFESIPPNPLLAAAFFGLTCCTNLWKPGTFDVNFTNNTGQPLLFLAAQQGNLEVMELLLARGVKTNITEAVVTAAASNQGSGKAMMELLLARITDISITEAVVIAAASNRDSGKAIMELLLSRNANTSITEAVVTAAASNWGTGKALMELLLARNANICITEAVVRAAAQNKRHGKAVMELLLARDAKISITEAVVIAAASNRESGAAVMELLLTRNANIRITEAAVRAAASNRRSGNAVMELLLARDTNITITEAAIIAIIHNFDASTINLLLARDSNISITEAVLRAAAENRYNSKEVMELLLTRNANISITETVVIAAASNRESGTAVMELLLTRNANISITEAVVRAAASNRRSGKAVMELLLARDTNITITEAAIIAITHSFDANTINLLLARDSNISITEAVLRAVAENHYNSKEVMELLLARNTNTSITEAVVPATADNQDSGKVAMELLLTKDTSTITEAAIISIIYMFDANVIKSLFARNVHISITKPVVRAAVENKYYGEEIMRLLLNRDTNITITEAAIIDIIRKFNTYTIKLLEQSIICFNFPRKSVALRLAGSISSRASMIMVVVGY
jgi:GNAT superfamily N-acetyltransferase